MKFLGASFIWFGYIVVLLLLLSSCSGHVLPSMEPLSTLTLLDSKEVIDHSTESVFSRSTFASFGNTTSLLQRSSRLKRSTCSSRPIGEEVMEYGDLKLKNRCWDDCDCRKGRYCTSFSWCHDLPTPKM
ncbi:hypothetical protein Ocin01_07217 [Orchesella cincta]|uniref:Uncharacterized protein n=1 Tax=Orchesella cincta TaxID=48709 RepID=A0A1D2N2K9_ORCCI|nr:hypothetical protein Ocin01_07217 [Orchesella cincta]